MEQAQAFQSDAFQIDAFQILLVKEFITGISKTESEVEISLTASEATVKKTEATVLVEEAQT